MTVDINLDRYAVAAAEALRRLGGSATRADLLDESGLTDSQLKWIRNHIFIEAERLGFKEIVYDPSERRWVFIDGVRDFLRLELQASGSSESVFHACRTKQPGEGGSRSYTCCGAANVGDRFY